MIEALLGSKQHPEYKGRLEQWAKGLLKDKVKQLIEKARTEALEQGRAQNVEEALGYFERNIQRMQYGTFRKQGFFIGSGVIEAGCKTVVGAHCKQSGMFWSAPGRKTFLPCAASTPAIAWTRSGNTGSIRKPRAMMLWLWPLE